MKRIYATATNIVSPLGINTADNFSKVLHHVSSAQLYSSSSISAKPFYASLFSEEFWKQSPSDSLTHFEQLIYLSVKDILEQTGYNPAKTGLIISSTKGNISLIEHNEMTPQLKQQISLTHSGQKIVQKLGFSKQPIIISQACISGLVALITARRMLLSGCYENIIVVGADLVTQFILSGFQSFMAASDEACQPFDANRKGINLGEGAAGIALSIHAPTSNPTVEIKGGAISNDANHISGPSRTGAELNFAIQQALTEAHVQPSEIDFISLHGTATLYNDDMESRAVALAGLQSKPVHSLKGYFGHTLGAAGLIESVICIQSLIHNTLIPTKGFTTLGTVEPLVVCNTLQHLPLHTCLKTASGFGGCNAAIIWQKN